MLDKLRGHSVNAPSVRKSMLHFILSTLMLLAFALNDQTGNVGYATVRGTVSSNGHPVANARVVAYSGADVQETRTTADGKYLFISLTPGTYKIVALSHDDNGYSVCPDRKSVV